jgi:hypothetical protein
MKQQKTASDPRGYTDNSETRCRSVAHRLGRTVDEDRG